MKKINFHGGCLSCSSQDHFGTERCIGCQFFEANWNLPDLRMRQVTEKDIERVRLKKLFREREVEKLKLEIELERAKNPWKRIKSFFLK